jgi:hypothetical protein
VIADRVQLQQVLTNLVLNGLEAMKDVDSARELTIKSEPSADNRHLLISVSDTGMGLAPDQADQIFRAFFSTKPEGTGMGLPISRSIIESHGGRLWATSNELRGAVFQFTLPAEDQEAVTKTARTRCGNRCDEKRVMNGGFFLRGILGTALLAFVCPRASPLDHSRKISQYGHNLWRIQDGYLPGPPEGIAQTTDGYLWIGTDAGLLRFDGVRFVPWASPNGEQLPDYQIFSLLGASDGGLWIGTAKGLARWKAAKLTLYKDLPNRINAIAEDRQGNIWIARSRIDSGDKRGPLCRVSGGAVQCFGQRNGIFVPTAMGLAIDASGISGFMETKDSANGRAGFPPLISKGN